MITGVITILEILRNGIMNSHSNTFIITFLGIILIAYVLYLNYTGQEVPKTVEDLKKSVSGNVDKAKEAASKSIENAKESTRKVVEEKAKEKIDEILSN